MPREHKARGFSLTECMVYSCIMMLVSVFAMDFFCQQHQQLTHFMKDGNELMSLYAAHRLFMQDIQQASADASNWFIEHDQIICKQEAQAVGWLWQNNSLYRIVGEYDFANRYWLKKSTALVNAHIQSFD